MPQIAGVFGDCIAGGGYMPIISDRVYMTEQAYMVIAGAALIKGAKSQKLTSLDIGGPEVHVPPVGLRRRARARRRDARSRCIRRESRACRARGADFYRGTAPTSAAPHQPARELGGLFPRRSPRGYDASEVLARLVDQSLFWEIMPEVGEEMICGIGRVGGLYVGFVINRQGLIGDPEHRGRKRPPASSTATASRRSRVLARLQRRRHPARLAAGHLGLRHRRRGRGATACSATARA